MAFRIKFTHKGEQHLDRAMVGSVEAGRSFAILSLKKPPMLGWMMPKNPPRVGARTLTIQNMCTYDYLDTTPHAPNPRANSNITRVATLAHPFLRAALPALPDDAPEYLGCEICESHLKWLVDAPLLLRDPRCVFHHRHMTVVQTDEPRGAAADFKTMPYLIGSDNSKQFEVQVLSSMDEARAAVSEFRVWNNKSQDAKVYAFTESRTHFIAKILPSIVLLRNNEAVVRLGSRILRELLEEDDLLIERRHLRMIAAEVRSWANKLKLGEGAPLFYGGRALTYTGEDVSAAWERGEAALLERKESSSRAAAASPSSRHHHVYRIGKFFNSWLRDHNSPFGDTMLSNDDDEKIYDMTPRRGDRILRLLFEDGSTASSDFLLAVADCIHASKPRHAMAPRMIHSMIWVDPKQRARSRVSFCPRIPSSGCRCIDDGYFFVPGARRRWTGSLDSSLRRRCPTLHPRGGRASPPPAGFCWAELGWRVCSLCFSSRIKFGADCSFSPCLSQCAHATSLFLALRIPMGSLKV